MKNIFLTKCCNPRTTCAGQFVSRGFVVLLRKSNPQNHNLQTAVEHGVRLSIVSIMKKVAQIPVEKLSAPFADANLVSRGIGVERAKELMRLSELNIVLANVGLDFGLVLFENRFNIFKNEIIPRICFDLERIDYNQYLGSYCYVLSEWRCGNGQVVMLAEMWH